MRISKRAKKPARSRKTAIRKHFADFTRRMTTRTLFIGVLGVLGAAMVIGAATSNLERGKTTAHAAAKSPSAPMAASTSEAAADTPAPIAPAPSVAALEPASTPRVKAPPVTVTGCLEQTDDRFRLKDTSGDNAPKARSWKSGFLRKGPASIDVVDAANRTRLPSHVGQRVSVTGVLVDREMQVRSLQRVAPSCSAKS